MFTDVNEPYVNPTLDPEHFETVLDSVSEAVVTVTRNFVITSFNRAAERLTGFRRSEVVGRHCYDILHTTACRTSEMCPLTVALQTGGTVGTRELTVVNRRNEEVHVRINFSAFHDLDGQFAGGVEMIEDVAAASSRGNGNGQPAELPILEASERRAIEDVLRRVHWNRTVAAQELGISRITLWRKMRKLHIRPSVARRAL